MNTGQPDPAPPGGCQCACFLSHPATGTAVMCAQLPQPGLTIALHTALFGETSITVCVTCHSHIMAATATRVTVSDELKNLVRYIEQSWEESQGWDCPPQFFFHFPPAVVGIQLEPDDWKRADNEPAAMMERIGGSWPSFQRQMAQKIPAGAAVSDLAEAVMLIVETWGFDRRHPKNMDGDEDEYNEVAQAGMIHAHPDRLEMRMTLYVDALGGVYAIQRIRDGEPTDEAGRVWGIENLTRAMAELLAVTRQ